MFIYCVCWGYKSLYSTIVNNHTFATNLKLKYDTQVLNILFRDQFTFATVLCDNTLLLLD